MTNIVGAVTTALWILIELIQFGYMAYLMWRQRNNAYDSGMAAAMVGGLTVSIILFIMKKTMTHQKLTLKKEPIKLLRYNSSLPVPKWEEVEPDWRK